MTMRMVGLMQEMPNREKRRARADVAHAAIGRAEAAREIEALKVRLVTAQAWIASHAVERKLHLFGELRAENRLLAEAVRARLAGGRGQLTDQVAARQEAAQLAEREDELEQQRRLAPRRTAALGWRRGQSTAERRIAKLAHRPPDAAPSVGAASATQRLCPDGPRSPGAHPRGHR